MTDRRECREAEAAATGAVRRGPLPGSRTPKAVKQVKAQAHNRLKLPWFLVCFASGTVMVVGGALTGIAGLVIPGAFVAVASLPPIWVIVRGRGNPWGMRSPLDPSSGKNAAEVGGTRDRTSVRADTSRQRVKYGFVLAGAVGFVLIGVALIAVGVATSRPRDVFVGALGCLFFGACAWFALAFLRGSV